MSGGKVGGHIGVETRVTYTSSTHLKIPKCIHAETYIVCKYIYICCSVATGVFSLPLLFLGRASLVAVYSCQYISVHHLSMRKVVWAALPAPTHTLP